MRRLSNFLYFQVLVLVIIAGAMLGCGSWFAGKQKDSASANTTNTNTHLVPLDSLLVKKECHNMGPNPLNRLPHWGDTLSACAFYFDTAKCKLRPDLSYETAFTKPEFKQFFNIPPDFTVEYWKDITGGHHYWMYYKGIRIDAHSLIGFVKDSTGCIRGARVGYYYPKGEPENIQVSPEVAIDSAIAYYTRYYKYPLPQTKYNTKLAYYIISGTNTYIYLCHKVDLSIRYFYVSTVTGQVIGLGNPETEAYITTPVQPR